MCTIHELGHALAARTMSTVELLDDRLAAIDDHLDHGGATYTHIDRAATREAAAASDALRARGYVPSALAGVPVSIKDLFDVKGQVTTAGSNVLRDVPPAVRDAVAVARLRDAGAVLVGRTNMSEFALSGLGLNPHFGTPLNSVHRHRLAGGSSSGAATSVALGHVAAALGTDTGGSVRIPAAFCGLVGFKPTARRVSLDGVVPLSTSFDSIGPIARSVDCCALVDGVISGHTLGSTARPLSGLRFGITSDYVADDLDDTVSNAFNRTINMLRRAGALVERFAFPELYETEGRFPLASITATQAWAWHREHVARNAASYDPRVLKRLRAGEGRSAADYIDLLAARKRFISAARTRLAKFDAWLMPTVAILPPELAAIEHNEEAFFALDAKVLRNPGIVNFMDGCALTLPCHQDDELPVGISLCGPALADASILAIGRTVEALLHASAHAMTV
ncbi:amidase [Paraburkholderia sp. DHOC27]|uniref:amidase n=1 Tax=Paraburkholderia sp. DHOC27 TaxID=2303330 RepID=UPI000E3D4AC7|nr:amidase [Paraburkholderia sp. DHOC27]RFU49190.1 amidase [Paraburkholderia sp. DHOC27]